MQDTREFDAIVVGSGIGGMAAAALLARAADKRVLVLERHYEIGGLTHTFRRGRYSWDVGLHYVGEVQPGTLPRRLFDYATGGELSWRRMPEDFEHIELPGVAFDVPADETLYRRRLQALFPDESAAIAAYFRDVKRVAGWWRRDLQAGFLPGPLAALLRAVNRCTRGPALSTTADYLGSRFNDPALRALLPYCWMDYGLPPRRSAFALHALIVNHYLGGAYYPAGGAERIARLMEHTVEQAGGAVLVRSEVEEVLTRDGRVRGVRVRHAASGETAEYYAPVVISDAGALTTYRDLLSDTAHRTVARHARELARLDTGPSAIQLFVGLRKSPETLGVDGENHWLFEGAEHDPVPEEGAALLAGRPRAVFLSFPSLKAGDDRPPTAELIVTVAPEAFAAWREQRDVAYQEAKRRMTDGLLALVERHLPGFTELVDYAELATPLTLEHYIGRSGGRMYGIAAGPARYRERALRPGTPIRGLYLAGNDASALGIVGAFMGGFAAVSQVLGLRGTGRLMGALGRSVQDMSPRHAKPLPTLPGAKLRAHVIGQAVVAPGVCELTLELDRAIPFVPGQYLRIEVADTVWRDYSIAHLQDRRAALLIDTRSGGPGSRRISSLSAGDTLVLRGPMGPLQLQENARAKVFVATGTGIAPLLPMLQRLADSGFAGEVRLWFGCRDRAAAFVGRYVHAFSGIARLRTTVCLSGETAQPSAGEYCGRVTDLLRGSDLDWLQTDLYVAGNPQMVQDVMSLAETYGACVHAERY